MCNKGCLGTVTLFTRACLYLHETRGQETPALPSRRAWATQAGCRLELPVSVGSTETPGRTKTSLLSHFIRLRLHLFSNCGCTRDCPEEGAEHRNAECTAAEPRWSLCSTRSHEFKVSALGPGHEVANVLLRDRFLRLLGCTLRALEAFAAV